MIFPKSFFQKSISLCLLTVLAFVLFQTCTDDKSPTEPETQPSIATATIGSGGGILKTDEFELSVPAGAFPIDTKLTLSLVENENSRLDNIVSKEYMIEGLPQSFSQPLTIKIKYSGELTDTSYIAIGENVWVSSLNEKIISYHFLPAKDSSGYISTQIAPTENGNSSISKSASVEEVTDGVNIYAVTSKNKLSNGNHFKIFYSSAISESYVQNIATYLETSYDKYKELGFKYDRRTLWPIEVYLEELDNSGGNVYGYCANTLFNDINFFSNNRTYNTSYIRLNSLLLGNMEEIQTTIGHEFFHLVQLLYDTRGAYAKANDPPINYWFTEATSTWSEGLFSSNSNYVSGVFTSNAAAVIDGADASNNGSLEIRESYGYGMAAFIKYITSEFGSKILVKFYDATFAGIDAFDAINKVLPTQIANIWDDFLIKFLTYNIYELPPRWTTANAAAAKNSFVIREDSDTLKIFSHNYDDLSAQLFYITVNNANLNLIDSNSAMLFETSGNINGNILLFKENNNECVLIKKGSGNSLILNNFIAITDSGYKIIAAVSNSNLKYPYTGQSSGELKIRVKTPQFNDLSFDFGVIAELRAVNGEEVVNYEYELATNKDYVIHGSFTDNTYSAKITTPLDGGGSITDEIIVNFNADRSMITKLVFTEVANLLTDGNANIEIHNINIPLIESTNEKLVYAVTGNSTCSHVSELLVNSTGPDKSINLTGFHCTPQSRIRLVFTKGTGINTNKKIVNAFPIRNIKR